MDDYGKEKSFNYPYPAKIPSFLAQLGIFELERWEIEKEKRKKDWKEKSKKELDEEVEPENVRTGSEGMKKEISESQ